MRFKTELSEMPNDFCVNKESEKAVITFYTDVEKIVRENETVYAATAWTIEKNWHPEIEKRISENVDLWLSKAKEECYAEAAKAVRKERNNLLSASDKDMAFDRLSISLPENITAINLLSSVIEFVKSLKNIMTGEMAKYRQALRDIPEQEGFPYNVIFPTKPKK